MNILDLIKPVINNIGTVKLGYLPDKPNEVIALFEYRATPPEHSFCSTDFIYNVQARVRGTYSTAESVASALNKYIDNDIAVLQVSPVFDIGYDENERQEYTVNFEVRRF